MRGRRGVVPVAALSALYARPWPTPDEMAAALATGTVGPAGGQNGDAPGPGWHMRRLRETAEYLMAVRERLSSWVRHSEAEAAARGDPGPGDRPPPAALPAAPSDARPGGRESRW